MIDAVKTPTFPRGFNLSTHRRSPGETVLRRREAGGRRESGVETSGGAQTEAGGDGRCSGRKIEVKERSVGVKNGGGTLTFGSKNEEIFRSMKVRIPFARAIRIHPTSIVHRRPAEEDSVSVCEAASSALTEREGGQTRPMSASKNRRLGSERMRFTDTGEKKECPCLSACQATAELRPSFFSNAESCCSVLFCRGRPVSPVYSAEQSLHFRT